MTRKTPTPAEAKAAAERRERNEMFGFHPDILRANAGLPRRSYCSPYQDVTDQ